MKIKNTFLKSKKGYTLLELLAVVGIIAIVATFSLAVFSELDKISNNRVDMNRVLIYNRAFEDFRFTDYTTLTSTKTENKVVIVEGGSIKINQYLNLEDVDVEALSYSGRGSYPQNAEQCIAAIRAYCGTNDILQDPAVGMSYTFVYNVSQGKCEVKAISDIDTSNPDWIDLNAAYRRYG